MNYKTKKWVTVKRSLCCNADVVYNGFVNLTCYGYTCWQCQRKCKYKEVTELKWAY